MRRWNPVRGWAGWLVIVALAVWAQATLLGGWRPYAPDLPILLLGFIALEARRQVVVPAAVMVGVFECLYSAGDPLLRITICVVVAVGLLVLRRWLFREHRVTALIVFAGASLAVEMIEVGVLVPPGRPDLLLRAAGFALSTALVTGVMAMLIVPFLRRAGFCRRLTAPVRF